LREILRVQKLGKNHGGYFGETINIQSVLRDCEAAAQAYGWTTEIFHEAGDFKWLTFHRQPVTCNLQPATRLYISAGIHGDEPAAPLAALKLLQQNQWPDNTEIFLLPCLNPVGYTRNSRVNQDGIDLNRDYRHPQADSTHAHIEWLKRQPKFDLYLCLHEDWEAHGFYLYEQNPDGKPSLALPMIEVVRAICPIDHSEIIEGREAHGGIIHPNIVPAERPQWPEAVWLLVQKARQGYTLEAPSDFELPVRVDALVAAVNRALFDA
jgi:hypothetical protein